MFTRPCVIGQTTCQGKLYVMPLCLIFCGSKMEKYSSEDTLSLSLSADVELL